MASVAVYARDWNREIDLGLDPARFRHILLCEGDSWMDRSSPSQLSLPWALEESFNQSNDKVLLVNLSQFGDTMVRIGQHVNDEFLQWLRTPWNYRGILVSAGGNDFIDAAAEVVPGQGILNVFQPGMTGAACVNAAAVATLRNQYMDRHFDTLLEVVRQHQPNTTVYLNSYCTPVARNAPAFPGGKPWLRRAYINHGIPLNLWPEVTDEVFKLLDQMVRDWSQKAGKLVKVPTATANLVPASADSGSSGDWQNEIHPNKSGWRKLAAVWRTAMAL